MTSGPYRGLASCLSRAPIWLYRLRLAGLLGDRFLLLTHTGRLSGLPRQTVLEVMRHDLATDSYVVAVGFGERSNWYRNTLVCPDVVLQLGRRRRTARAQPLASEAALHELREYVRWHPVAVRFVARLLSFQIDGSDATLRALAARIPVVEFRCGTSDPNGHTTE
jgi:deazaflavin-dependent oxidoreductase (nitroreductase family)